MASLSATDIIVLGKSEDFLHLKIPVDLNQRKIDQIPLELRKILMEDIPSYSTHSVTFNVNTGVIPDEIIAHRIAMSVLINENLPRWNEHFLQDTGSKFEYELLIRVIANVNGFQITEEHVTDEDGNPINFLRETSITSLLKGEELNCRILVGRGVGKEHVKWCPVASPFYKRVDDGFVFTVPLTGALNCDTIITYLKETKKLNIREL